jgi:hypothetical protein
VGFLAGREQMRYQIATVMTGALAHAFDGFGAKTASTPTAAAPATAAPPPPKATTPPKPAPITAKLVRKGFREKDFSGSNYIKAAVTFSVEFHNETEKDIRAFDGVLSFNDLLGNRVYAAKLTISDPIKSGQSFQWDGELEYNEFISDHARLRSYDMNNTAVVLQVHKVLYTDGTSESEGEG